MAQVDTDYAPLADPAIILALEQAVGRGVEIHLVVGPGAYAAIHKDPAARASYNNLVGKGAVFAFSPHLAPREIKGAYDDKHTFAATQTGRTFNVVTSQADVCGAGQIINMCRKKPLPLADFDRPLEDLMQRCL